jgi:hypothetical protein
LENVEKEVKNGVDRTRVNEGSVEEGVKIRKRLSLKAKQQQQRVSWPKIAFKTRYDVVKDALKWERR